MQLKLKTAFSLIGSALVILTSVSAFAQSRWEEARGLGDASAILADGASRKPCGGFQKAVNTNGPAPVYAYDDLKQKRVCVMNCESSQANYLRKSKVICGDGETSLSLELCDQRPNGYLTEEEKVNHSGIGRTECPSPYGTKIVGTATVAGSFNTMITAAHNFSYVDRVSKKRIKIDPNLCSVVFYGREVTKIAIIATKSRWDDPGGYGDPSNDIALIKLATDSPAEKGAPLLIDFNITEPITGEVVGFHSDIPNNTEIRRSEGKLYPNSSTSGFVAAAKSKGLPLRNMSKMAVASYDSNHGTSGALVYHKGKAIGIHTGSFGADENLKFDLDSNHNTFILFDQRLKSDLASFK